MMSPKTRSRIMMISTHGYVSPEPEFGKPDTGGQVVFVLELSKCLARMGYEVDILTRQFESQEAEEIVNDRVRVLRFPCGGDDFIPKETLCESIPEWVANASDYIEENGLKYSFINSHYWDAGLAGQALANTMEIPHLHTPHSIGAWKRDNMDGEAAALEKKYNFNERIREEKVIYDECDWVIATTPTQRDILKESAYDTPASKILVIPPGYDDRRFFPVSVATRSALKNELGLEGKIVLALGRIANNKGYDLLIRSMPPVFQRVKDARLLLAIGSTDPSDSEVEQVAGFRKLAEELGIADRVIFGDYIPDDQLADYYRAADVFALSSRYEPFGMTAVEAMACGTPTVITTEGGLWEQVTWGLESLYANPFDPEAFGHAIASVLSHREVSSQLAKYGSQKARARFTWTGIAQQILKHLHSQADTPAPDRPAEENLAEAFEVEAI
ncbi:glycosyltransferase [Lignipirellula cremea]|uniref:Mannosylfructose-phosphate synthase n=1 Tax=Lignipirellula cremea TaxID=2528010 RepID=A0A518DZT9_9BACT|nr:glycosyltransferase [Lignipirellula cremea]QDU97353.1 Mannosylfructose-phosphate synthase [Lignipirellula cremea]